MSLRKDVQEIKSLLAGATEEKIKKLDEILYYLSKIELKVKNVSEVPGPDGKTDIRVVYEIPHVFIKFDDNGNIVENETFKAINMLNLISIDDMIKIQRVIENKNKLK